VANKLGDKYRGTVDVIIVFLLVSILMVCLLIRKKVERIEERLPESEENHDHP
jgi:hypothetical protein